MLRAFARDARDYVTLFAAMPRHFDADLRCHYA